MKISSGQLIAKQYGKIIENLKEDTQNYPWKLDELGESMWSNIFVPMLCSSGVCLKSNIIE